MFRFTFVFLIPRLMFENCPSFVWTLWNYSGAELVDGSNGVSSRRISIENGRAVEMLCHSGNDKHNPQSRGRTGCSCCWRTTWLLHVPGSQADSERERLSFSVERQLFLPFLSDFGFVCCTTQIYQYLTVLIFILHFDITTVEICKSASSCGSLGWDCNRNSSTRAGTSSKLPVTLCQLRIARFIKWKASKI